VPEWFVYCRDRPDTAELRMQLVEEHWSFMDGYAERMVARGPTLTEDGLAATGSLHVVDLPDPEAVRVFAYEEPNYKAGVYAEVLIRRFRNLLGRTMWEFGGDPDASRFLIIAHARPGTNEAQPDFLDAGVHGDRLILCGPLLSDDGSAWVGDAFAVDSPGREAVDDLIRADPLGRAHLYERVEVHPWRFGGRR
jgi:uncharacterized protein YciI